MGDESHRRLGQVPALDGLRGIAIALVVLTHLTVLANPFTFELFTNDFANGFALGGILGVDMFFVLSGFLITAVLLRERDATGTVSFGDFYRRRALRLLPALGVLLVAHLIYSACVGLSMPREVASTGAALGYVFNIVQVYRPTAIDVRDLGHLWSLSIEEQFYFVWPLAVLVLLRVRRNAVPIAVAAVVGALWFAAHGLAMQHADTKLIGITRLELRGGSILIGSLAAWAWVNRVTPTQGLRAAAWIATAVMIVSVGYAHQGAVWLYDFGFITFAISVAVVIVAVIETDWGRLLKWQPLRTLGRVSYGVYLWHLPIFYALLRYSHPRSTWARIALGLALTGLATWLSWTFVERPAIAYGRRKSRAPHPVAER